ncbi:MAG: hypothetical protein EXQ95_11430, partial [Alphaproteobacteria bacterium]|nr:hypothetical protein [Alphaproteobacteria bacterium]
MTLAVASSDRSLTRHRDTSESVLETARLTIRRMGRGDVARIFAITSRLDELDLSASALDEAGLEELRERFEHEWQTFGMGYM